MAAIARIAAKLHLPIIRMFVLPGGVFCARQKLYLFRIIAQAEVFTKWRIRGGGLASCDPSAPGLGIIHEGSPPPRPRGYQSHRRRRPQIPAWAGHRRYARPDARHGAVLRATHAAGKDHCRFLRDRSAASQWWRVLSRYSARLGDNAV